jgi:hypothetical protein
LLLLLLLLQRVSARRAVLRPVISTARPLAPGLCR